VDLSTPVCSACGRAALFDTPYGRFCLEHTKEEMRADDELWMPQLVTQGSPRHWAIRPKRTYRLDPLTVQTDRN